MAQALEKVNVSKTEKNVFFCTKNGYTFPKFSFRQNPLYSQKSLTHKEKQPHTLSQHLVQQIPNNILLLLQAPEVRNG